MSVGTFFARLMQCYDCPFDDKGDPWITVANKAGVYPHEDLKKEKWSEHTIQRRVTEVSGIKSYVAAVNEPTKRARITWYTVQLRLRPHGVNWRCIIWSDELHWPTGPRHVKRIKRCPGNNEKYKQKNMQYNKKGNLKKLDKEKEHQFQIFTVVGYNFRWAVQYNAGNSNGKMNGRTYKLILNELEKGDTRYRINTVSGPG
jgi:hypothetical protein